MARLIVEDGGQTRRFRLNEGKLVLGSGEDCSLRLESADVATRHVVLEFERGRATLRPESGVLPPQIGGRALREATVLEHEQVVEIGQAKMHVEYDDAPVSPPAPTEPARPPAVRSKASSRPGGRARSGRSMGATRSAAGDQDGAERRSRSRGQGLPTWLPISFAAVLLAGGLFWLQRRPSRSADEHFSATGSLSKMRAMREDGNFLGIEREFEKIARHADAVPPEFQAEFDKLRAQLDDHQVASRLVIQNQFGTNYLKTQIRSFETGRVKKRMEGPWVRVLLKRCQYFLSTWPEHHDRAEVDRLVERYSEVVDLDALPTLADVQVEVETLTWVRPKQYAEAFEVLKKFTSHATEEEQEACITLADELLTDQEAHFGELMQEAKADWKSGKIAPAVSSLVRIVNHFENEEMVTEAAMELVNLPDIESWFGSYQREQPHTWKRLLLNATVRKKAEELGMGE